VNDETRNLAITIAAAIFAARALTDSGWQTLSSPRGNTSSSHNALSQTLSALLRSPTVLVCVGAKPNSFVTCATSNAADEIRNETVYVYIARLYGKREPGKMSGNAW
jgi:hypothetical protein